MFLDDARASIQQQHHATIIASRIWLTSRAQLPTVTRASWRYSQRMPLGQPHYELKHNNTTRCLHGRMQGQSSLLIYANHCFMCLRLFVDSVDLSLVRRIKPEAITSASFRRLLFRHSRNGVEIPWLRLRRNNVCLRRTTFTVADYGCFAVLVFE